MPAERRACVSRSLVPASLIAAAFIALASGLAVAQSNPTNGADLISADVAAAARQWASGDLTGRNKLQAMARAGSADAQETLGELLMAGMLIARDPVAACGYFAQAAPSRPDALHSLAACTEMGVGGAPNLVRAAELYKQAADKGYAKSMCALGNLYITGRGVPKDPAQGASLCLMGAKAGNADAQTDLGNLYLQGLGVPRDMVQARYWYEKAAASGQRNAEFILAKIYWNGSGVAADPARAAVLMESSFKHGRFDAAGVLASWAMARWKSGSAGGDPDALDEAIAWYQEAVKFAPNDQKKAEAQTGLSAALATKAERGPPP